MKHISNESMDLCLEYHPGVFVYFKHCEMEMLIDDVCMQCIQYSS